MADAADKTQAEAWVAAEIAHWREVPYFELVGREGEALHAALDGADGNQWVLETQIFWDDGKKENIRVMVDVWNPRRLISTSTAIDSFIRAPDGSFVGE